MFHRATKLIPHGLSHKEWKDPNVQEIVQFFLFECPVPGTSKAAPTFDDLGWQGSFFSTLKAELLSCAGKDFVYEPSKAVDLQARISATPLPPTSSEYAVFMKYDEKRVMESLFGSIRNAFAHGAFIRYKVDGLNYYYLENHKGFLKASLNVQEETLLAWIRAVKTQPAALREEHRGRKSK